MQTDSVSQLAGIRTCYTVAVDGAAPGPVLLCFYMHHRAWYI